MVNSRAKGNSSVRKAIAYYTDEGWLVDKVEKTGKYIKDKDLYNLFDLVGVKSNQTIFIQVKTNRPANKEGYVKFAKKYAGEHLFIECYTWYDFVGPTIHSYRRTGKVIRFDYRKKVKKDDTPSKQ